MNKSVDIFYQVADAENISITALEKAIGASRGVLSRAKKNNSDVQMKWFLSLIENYPAHDYSKIIGIQTTNDEDAASKVSEPSEIYSKAETNHVILGARDEIQADIKELKALLDATAITLSRGMQRSLEYQVKVIDFIDEVKEAGAMDALGKLNLFLNKNEA